MSASTCLCGRLFYKDNIKRQRDKPCGITTQLEDINISEILKFCAEGPSFSARGQHTLSFRSEYCKLAHSLRSRLPRLTFCSLTGAF